MISVITVTNRYGGIDVAYNSLRKQDTQDFEWILVDDLYDERKDEVADYVRGIKFKHIKPRPRREGHVWNLVNAYNDGFRVIGGTTVVSLDDYIWIPRNGLSRFLDDFRAFGDHLYTGCGHKTAYPEIKDPKGKITIFEKPFTGVPQGILETDCRVTGKDHVELNNWSFFELNWAAFSTDAIRKIGGMDEDCQTEYGGQDKNMALRMNLMGHDTYIDHGNECIGFYHQGFNPRPKNWEEKNFNKGGDAIRAITNDIRPVVQGWL